MSFPKDVVDLALVAAGRCCCICHKFCGVRIETHHIRPVSKGGDDSFENCIPLCFDCHAEVEHYNDQHPRGRKFSESELRKHRDTWFSKVEEMNTLTAPVTMLDGYGPHVVCPKCGKQIHFVRTERGNKMPCELELKQGDGRMTLIDHNGVMHRKASAKVHGYEPHFGHCDTGSRRPDGSRTVVIKNEHNRRRGI
jgi:hypothetical protein